MPAEIRHNLAIAVHGEIIPHAGYKIPQVNNRKREEEDTV